MTTREHTWISTLIMFPSIEGILGGILVDLFFIPIYIHDKYRELKGLPFKEVSNFWIKMNWFLHSFWFVCLLALLCIPSEHLKFWQGWLLHLALDFPTHSQDRAMRPFYPLSNWRLDLWKMGYIKCKD